jgi:hypothetical protein
MIVDSTREGNLLGGTTVLILIKSRGEALIVLIIMYL